MTERGTDETCQVCEQTANTYDIPATRMTRATLHGFVPSQVGGHRRIARAAGFTPSVRTMWKYLVHHNDHTSWKTCWACFSELRTFEASLNVPITVGDTIVVQFGDKTDSG